MPHLPAEMEAKDTAPQVAQWRSGTGFWLPPPWQGVCSLLVRWPSDALLWFGCLRLHPQRPCPHLLCGRTCNSFLCCCRFRGPEVMSTVSGTRSTTVTFTVHPGTSQPITLQSRPPDYESRNSGPRRAPSPVVSPTELSKEVLPAPLPAATAAPRPPSRMSSAFQASPRPGTCLA